MDVKSRVGKKRRMHDVVGIGNGRHTCSIDDLCRNFRLEIR